jgi:hypothetical protein
MDLKSDVSYHSSGADQNGLSAKVFAVAASTASVFISSALGGRLFTLSGEFRCPKCDIALEYAMASEPIVSPSS